MKIKLRFGNKFCKLFNIKTIVVYPYVLFQDPVDNISTLLIKHQFVLIAEIQRIGMFKFHLQYLVELLKKWRDGKTLHQARRMISFERCAKALENDSFSDQEREMLVDAIQREQQL